MATNSLIRKIGPEVSRLESMLFFLNLIVLQFNLDELKDNIIREIEKIEKKTLIDTFLNFSKRCDLVVEAQGGHINVE